MTEILLKPEKNQNEILAGNFIFYLVQDGFYRLDGGAMYGMVPKTLWEKMEPHDEKNRLYMSLNCLLAKRGKEIFLVDAGIGDKMDEKTKEIFGIEKEHTLLEEMAEIGVKPEDVTHVILTHMHFDHVGWITDNEGNLTFPNAKYYVQKKEWEEAFDPHIRFKDSYLIPYYEALKDSPSLILLDGDVEIVPGVSVMLVPGHSQGHQIAIFDGGSKKIAHLGDIVAIATMVRQNWTCGFDREPEISINNKQSLLEKAYEEKWHIVTAHDRTIRIGTLETVKGKYRLKKVI